MSGARLVYMTNHTEMTESHEVFQRELESHHGASYHLVA